MKLQPQQNLSRQFYDQLYNQIGSGIWGDSISHRLQDQLNYQLYNRLWYQFIGRLIK